MKLLTFRTSWSRIAATMNRPVEELHRRWEFLRDGMPRQSNDSVKPVKHVSFAEPLVTGGNVRTLYACWCHRTDTFRSTSPAKRRTSSRRRKMPSSIRSLLSGNETGGPLSAVDSTRRQAGILLPKSRSQSFLDRSWPGWNEIMTRATWKDEF